MTKMMEKYLPPSANWFCSRIIDFSVNGVLAYGSRNSIILLQLSEANDSLSVGFNGVINAHTNRVSGIQFCRQADNKDLLACVGDDRLVHVVNVQTKDIVYKHQNHSTKITCVSWTSSNYLATCVISGDDSGRILVANIDSKSIKEFSPFNAAINCISCCRHALNLAAIGYVGGKIIVIDLANGGSVICDVKGHEGDVLALCWAPFPGAGRFQSEITSLQDGQEASKVSYLLASSGRDKAIRMWSVFDQLCFRTLTVPANVGDGFYRNVGEQAWLTVNWLDCNEDVLLSGCLTGSMLSWDLKRNKKCWSVLDKGKNQHSRSIFNIATYKNVVVTVSMDRLMMFWSVTEAGVSWKCSIPTLGGPVSQLTFSPISSDVLAFGCGDATIRVWNTSTPDNPFDVSLFWQSLKTKVTAVAWHPKKEGHLAFGTTDGRVGIYNVLSSKPPTISKGLHRDTKVVYTVCWGPRCPTNKSPSDLGLYSCGGKSIFLHQCPLEKGAVNLNRLLIEANPSLINTMQWTDVAWKPNYELLCLGSKKGYIELYDPSNLKLLIVLPGPSGRKNWVHCLKWHPQYIYNTSTESKYKHVLAVASNVPIAHIYDLSQYLDPNSPSWTGNVNETDPDAFPIKIAGCQYQLAEHTAAIASLAWSPHFEGQLVTVSFDHTACVWDVFERKVVACYGGHQARVLWAEWNPNDPNVIFSCGEDSMIHVWKISEQDITANRVVEALKKPPKNLATVIEQKPVLDAVKADAMPENESSVASGEPEIRRLPDDFQHAIQEMLEKRRSDIVNGSGDSHVDETTSRDEVELPNDENQEEEEQEEEEDPSSNLERVEEKTIYKVDKTGIRRHSYTKDRKPNLDSSKMKLKKKKRKGDKSLFPITGRQDAGLKAATLRDCVMLADYMTRSSRPADSEVKFGTGDVVNLGLYGDRMDAYRLLKTEADNHIENGHLEYALQLEIWKGNIMEAVKMAAKYEQLSDSLVALAASVSPKFWSQMCSLYVKQLVTAKQPHKAVLFLLANHQVHEAVDLLKIHSGYREAIILAKFRLSPKDPLIAQLVEEWAEDRLKVDHNDWAAKCYLSIGKSEMASNVLSRKHDPASSRVAAYIAHKSGSDQAEFYLTQCITDCLVCHEFDIANEMISEYSQLEPFKPVIEIHKIICAEEWKTSGSGSSSKNLLSLVQSMIRGESKEVEKFDEILTLSHKAIKSSHVMSGAANENELETWISLNFVLASIEILQKDITAALNRILDMFIEVVNRFKGLYLLPLARSFISLEQMSSLVTSSNLSVLLGTDDALISDSESVHWWNAVLGFLCLAKLHQLLETSRSLHSKVKDAGGASVDDARTVVNVLLNEDHAQLSLLKSRLRYITIAMTVLAAVKNVHDSSKDSESSNTSSANITNDSENNCSSSSNISDVVYYDILLENPDVTVTKLQTEKENTDEEIVQSSKSFVVEKFPNPFDSCVLLLELCVLNKSEVWMSLLEEALAFGRRFVVTQRQSSVLDSFKRRFEEN